MLCDTLPDLLLRVVVAVYCLVLGLAFCGVVVGALLVFDVLDLRICLLNSVDLFVILMVCCSWFAFIVSDVCYVLIVCGLTSCYRFGYCRLLVLYVVVGFWFWVLIAYVRCCLWVRAVGLLADWLFVVVGWIGVFEFVFSCVL